jgi:hypothetical protein
MESELSTVLKFQLHPFLSSFIHLSKNLNSSIGKGVREENGRKNSEIGAYFKKSI